MERVDPSCERRPSRGARSVAAANAGHASLLVAGLVAAALLLHAAPASAATERLTAGGSAQAVGFELQKRPRRPTIRPPRDVTAEATSAQGAVVTYPRAKVRGAASLRYSKRSGTVFPLGTTTVTVTARNRAGKRAQARFQVTVVDTTAPLLSVPADVNVQSPNDLDAVVNFEATATDRVDGAVQVDCTPGSGAKFPVGTTKITCAAGDGASNRAEGSFNVVVTPKPRAATLVTGQQAEVQCGSGRDAPAVGFEEEQWTPSVGYEVSKTIVPGENVFLRLTFRRGGSGALVRWSFSGRYGGNGVGKLYVYTDCTARYEGPAAGEGNAYISAGVVPPPAPAPPPAPTPRGEGGPVDATPRPETSTGSAASITVRGPIVPPPPPPERCGYGHISVSVSSTTYGSTLIVIDGRRAGYNTASARVSVGTHYVSLYFANGSTRHLSGYVAECKTWLIRFG